MVGVILFYVLTITVVSVAAKLAFNIGKDIGVSEVWDIPKGGKLYLIVGIRQKSQIIVGIDQKSRYFASGLSDKNTHLIVFAVEEKKPRLVELSANNLAKEEYRVGDWISKTAAGDYQRIGPV